MTKDKGQRTNDQGQMTNDQGQIIIIIIDNYHAVSGVIERKSR